MMNCIFCAQKMNVSIDTCILGEDSSFLQQAAYITNGTYIKPSKQEGLLQYLLSIFLLEKSLKKIIQMPSQNVIDFRATCFETKKQIDTGYVCSICLSIYSTKQKTCGTCKSDFKMK